MLISVFCNQMTTDYENRSKTRIFDDKSMRVNAAIIAAKYLPTF